MFPYPRGAPSGLAADLRRLVAQRLVTAREGPIYGLADEALVRRQVAHYRRQFPDLLADVARDLFDGYATATKSGRGPRTRRAARR